MESKICTVCQEEKCTTEFNWKIKSQQILQPSCKKCSNKKSSEHYLANKDIYKKRARDFSKIQIDSNRENLYKYLEEHSCVDCGEKDPIVLQLDHVRGKKRGDVSKMVRSCYSWKSISEELDKCEVRCANCHSRKTAKQQGWFKFKG